MRKYSVLSAAIAGVAIMAMGTREARATSYASEVALSGTTLTFQLNEAASDVTLQATYGDGSTGTIDLGAQTVTFGTNGTTPSGSSVSYNLFPSAPTKVNVVVQTADGGGYLSGSGSAAPFLKIGRDLGFGVPRDVAVDNNPTDNTFGRFYVVQAANSAASQASQGIYIYDPNQGEREGTEPGIPQQAGITFAPFSGSGASPWKVRVGPDGYLYVDDWGDADATWYRTKDDINNTSLPTAVNIFGSVGANASFPAGGNHQDIYSDIVFQGSVAQGNFKVSGIDSSYLLPGGPSGFNRLYEWDFGSTATGYTGLPKALGDFSVSSVTGVTVNVAQNNTLNNQFIYTNNRSAGTDVPSVIVLSTLDNTTASWDSMTQTERGLDPTKFTASNSVATNPDYFRGGVWADQISSDGRFLLMMNVNSTTWAVPLLGGIPDMILAARMNTGGTANGRGIDMDLADNFYIASSGTGTVRIGAPGGNSTAITSVSNGTTANNTFTIAGIYAGNGNISDSTHWFAGFAPNGKDQEAIFKDAAAPLTIGGKVVNVDTPVTLGAISFNGSGYTLSGSSTITLNGFGANIFAQSGNNTISAPVSIQTDLGLYAAAGASLTVSGPVSFSPASSGLTYVVKNGAGTVTMHGIKANFLDVYQGPLKIARSSEPTVLTDLIAVDSTRTGAATSLYIVTGGQLDLLNNALIYDYSQSTNTTSPISGIETLVKSGFNAGAWNGTGIINSDGQTHTGYGVAVVEATELGLTSIQSTSIPNPNASVIVLGTFYGDNLLTGHVDLGNDFNLFLQGFLGGGTDWVFGDYNYDGKVDTTDFGLFVDGYMASGGSLGALDSIIESSPFLTASQKASLVPEPSSLAFFGLAVCGFARRRRR